MKQKAALVVGLAIVLSNASFVYADNSSSSGSMKEMRQTVRENRQNMVSTIQHNWQDFKASVSAVREEMKTKMQEERNTFKEQVNKLKDQNKQTVVTNVTDRFQTINTNQTDRMSQGLTTLGSILDRLTAKVSELKASGKDTTTVDAAITAAQTAISTAQTAVTTQAGKSYIPTITTDTTVGQNVSTVFTQLKTDLQTTQKSVVAAKEAVLTVAQELAKIEGGSSTTQ